MLSDTKCKKILNRNGIFYTDEEITIIKEVLYKIAEIELSHWKQHNKIVSSENSSEIK